MRLTFSPRIRTQHFHCLFTTGEAWGTFRQRTTGRGRTGSIEIAGGKLGLKRFGFGGRSPDTAPAQGGEKTRAVAIKGTKGRPAVQASLNGQSIPAVLVEPGLVDFHGTVRMEAEDKLVVHIDGSKVVRSG